MTIAFYDGSEAIHVLQERIYQITSPSGKWAGGTNADDYGNSSDDIVLETVRRTIEEACGVITTPSAIYTSPHTETWIARMKQWITPLVWRNVVVFWPADTQVRVSVKGYDFIIETME